jgi:hypothetical protein
VGDAVEVFGRSKEDKEWVVSGMWVTVWGFIVAASEETAPDS